MRQLVLDISPPALPTLENFVVGSNAQLLHILRQIQQRKCKEHFITLWGEPGSGRHHLLQALAGAQTVLPGKKIEIETGNLTLVNQVMALDEREQQALFNRYNQVRETGHGTIVISSDRAPLQLDLREDLRTRLGWGLVFQVIALSDQEKTAALYNQARQLGLQLTDELVSYLLNHYHRDMPALISVIHALDKFSLEKKRVVTLPLLRELLNREVT